MSFTDKGMYRQSLFIKQIPAQIAMTDIIPIAITTDTGGLGKKNPDIMQHCGLFKKRYIRGLISDLLCYFKTFAKYHPAVFNQCVVNQRARAVIHADDAKRIHFLLSFKVFITEGTGNNKKGQIKNYVKTVS